MKRAPKEFSRAGLAVKTVENDQIRYRGSNSHALYIGIGLAITVTWMPKYGLHWCASCNLNECVHVNRVAEWQKDNPPPEGM